MEASPVQSPQSRSESAEQEGGPSSLGLVCVMPLHARRVPYPPSSHCLKYNSLPYGSMNRTRKWLPEAKFSCGLQDPSASHESLLTLESGSSISFPHRIRKRPCLQKRQLKNPPRRIQRLPKPPNIAPRARAISKPLFPASPATMATG